MPASYAPYALSLVAGIRRAKEYVATPPFSDGLLSGQNEATGTRARELH
jgi:hypothetical protein